MTNYPITMPNKQDRPGISPECLIILWSLVIGQWSLVRADTLWVGSPGGGAIPIQNAKVLKIENDTIFFSANGADSKRELLKVQRMLIDNEPAFNGAEEAFAAGKWDAAVEGYQKTISATSKSWLRDYTTLKLLTAADK